MDWELSSSHLLSPPATSTEPTCDSRDNRERPVSHSNQTPSFTGKKNILALEVAKYESRRESGMLYIRTAKTMF